MKKIYIIFTCFVFLLSSCSKKATLYSWGKKKKSYHKSSYNHLKKNSAESLELLKISYEDIIQKQTGIRKTVPPGIYADYGFLLIQNDETEAGKKLLEKEISLYPESQIFILRILKMLEE